MAMMPKRVKFRKTQRGVMKGNAQRGNYVAHGDAVNLAARLQTGAKAGQVVISAPTYALVRDRATVRPLGQFSVKGKSEVVEAFVLESVAEA